MMNLVAAGLAGALLATSTPADVHPALPLPLAEMPVDLLASGESELELPRGIRYMCGPPELAEALADDDPSQGGRDVGRALSLPEVAVPALACRRTLASTGSAPTRAHYVTFGEPSSSRTVYVFAWTLAALPATSPLARDASAETGASPARCFAPFTKEPRDCHEQSPTVARLRDGLWVAGERDRVAEFVKAVAAAPKTPRRKDEASVLAAVATLDRPAVGFQAGNFWSWGEPLGIDRQSRLRSFAGVGTKTQERIYGILADSEEQAVALEQKLRDARAMQQARLEPLRRETPCESCTATYRKFHHLRPIRDLAQIKAVVVEREGLIVRVRHPKADVPDVEAAERLLDGERAARHVKIAKLLEAWAKGKPPTERELKAIGGEALVRTVRDRR